MNYPAGTLSAFGDSFTLGQGASLFARSYISRLTQKLGMTLDNRAVGGRASMVAIVQALAYLPSVNRTSGLVTWMASFNDVYRSAAGAKTVAKVKGCLRAFLANSFLTTAAAANGLTTSGTWSPMDNSIYDKSSIALGSHGKWSSATGATMSYTSSGDNLVIGTYNADGVIQHVGGFIVAVDGVTLATFSGDGCADGINDGIFDNRITHDAVVLSGLGAGSHSVVITITSTNGYPCYIDYIGTMLDCAHAAPVIVGEGAFQNAAGWALGGGIWSQAAMQTMNDALNAVVAEFSGYPIYVAKTNDHLNTATDICPDNNHPNDLGHAHIADAFMMTFA